MTAGSSGARLARRAQGALHGAQVAVLERLPGVVEEALQIGVVSAVLLHGATVPRRGYASPPCAHRCPLHRHPRDARIATKPGKRRRAVAITVLGTRGGSSVRSPPIGRCPCASRDALPTAASSSTATHQPTPDRRLAAGSWATGGRSRRATGTSSWTTATFGAPARRRRRQQSPASWMTEPDDDLDHPAGEVARRRAPRRRRVARARRQSRVRGGSPARAGAAHSGAGAALDAEAAAGYSGAGAGPVPARQRARMVRARAV